MSLLVYDLTGRATDLGITVALQFLPMLVLGAWAGAVADRRDKRTMAIVTQSMLAVQAFVLGAVVLAGLESVAVVWSLTFALGVLNAFENPARRGLVTELVEPHGHRQRHVAEHGGDDRARGSSVRRSARCSSDVIGSGWCFVLNGVSFAAVLASLLLLRRDELHAPPLAPRGGRPVREALALVAAQPAAAGDARRDGDRVDVRLQLRRLPAQAGRRALGRRELVRARAVDHQHRVVARLAGDGPHGAGSRRAGTSPTSCCSASAASAWRGRRTSASPCCGRCRSASAAAASSAPATASPSRRARRTCAAACWR